MYSGFTGETDMSRRGALDTKASSWRTASPAASRSSWPSTPLQRRHGERGVRHPRGQSHPALEGGKPTRRPGLQHWRWPTVKITKAEMFRAIRATGYPAAAAMSNVKEIRVASETPYGRAIWLDLLDSASLPTPSASARRTCG